ncbi:hypothetical protein N1037_18980 [Phaeobacter sp. G2]|nr:hypothetical protein N1037_18980 [Phaeobacter sp. G2]
MLAAERQVDSLLRGSSIRPILNAEQRRDLFHRYVEPTLHRELKHKGAAAGDGSYSAELIGYLEFG